MQIVSRSGRPPTLQNAGLYRANLDGAPCVLKAHIHSNSTRGFQMRKAFENEARVLVALQHVPGVVRVYGLTLTTLPDAANQRATALVMEEWPHTARAKEFTCLPDPAQAVVYIQLVRALSTMHEMGVCHGDIKPDNVVVEPRVLKAVWIDIGDRFTQGTSGFRSVSREQTAGRPASVADDVYALGITMRETDFGKTSAGHELITLIVSAKICSTADVLDTLIKFTQGPYVVY